VNTQWGKQHVVGLCKRVLPEYHKPPDVLRPRCFHKADIIARSCLLDEISEPLKEPSFGRAMPIGIFMLLRVGAAMKRRDFITLVGSAAAVWPMATRAQQPTIPTIGFLSSRARQESEVHTAAFRRGLSDSGFVEGQNVNITYRWAEGDYDRLAALASELVAMRPAVMVAGGGGPSALAAKAATNASALPTVFVAGDDPVKLGLVSSFNRPGGNITGVAFLTGELGAKRLGLICEVAPNASTVALLLNPNDPGSESQRQDVERAAQALGRRIIVLNASSEGHFEQNFATMAKEHAGGLIVENDPFFDSRRDQIMALAGRNGIPAIYHIREFPEAGGLMSYGASLADAYRQVGAYAGRILKGERPADLPIVQPTNFELVINLQTAKALGITVSPSLLARADEVIE